MRGLEEFLVIWRVLDVIIEEHRCLLSATARRELGEVGARSPLEASAAPRAQRRACRRATSLPGP